MPTPIFTAQIKDGKLILDNRARYEMYISLFEGKRVQVVVKKLAQNRSLNFNSYYWAVIVSMLANHTGYDKDEMHHNLKDMFASSPDPDRPGMKRVESTADMDTERFSKYCEAIKRWAASYLNLYIPDPNEVEPE